MSFTFKVIDSGTFRFYGLVTDLQLGATDPRFADEQSETRLPPALAKIRAGLTLSEPPFPTCRRSRPPI